MNLAPIRLPKRDSYPNGAARKPFPIALLRPRQWSKNLFIALPLLFRKQSITPADADKLLLTFVLFCVVASAIYIINDLFDREWDKRHPVKALQRPLASGQASRAQALGILAVLCLILAIALGLKLPSYEFLAAYFFLHIAYCSFLKTVPLIDLAAIALGFCLRLGAGAMILQVAVPWSLIGSTLLLSIYFSSLKRRMELVNFGPEVRQVLQHYSKKSLTWLSLGSIACSYLLYWQFIIVYQPNLYPTLGIALACIVLHARAGFRYSQGSDPLALIFQNRILFPLLVVWALAWAFASLPALSQLL